MAKQKQSGDKQPRAGRNGVIPPVEHQFKKGISGNPHGRPRTLSELRELIQEIGNEPLTQDGMTRIAAKVRVMYASKNSGDTANLLAYGFGKVKDEVESSGEMTIRIVRDDGKTDTPTDASPEAATSQKRSEAI